MPLLRDGFAFPNSGVEGLVTKSKGQQKWFFSWELPFVSILCFFPVKSRIGPERKKWHITIIMVSADGPKSFRLKLGLDNANLEKFSGANTDHTGE